MVLTQRFKDALDKYAGEMSKDAHDVFYNFGMELECIETGLAVFIELVFGKKEVDDE